MADTPTLARFYTGWEHAGTGKDGMPIYRNNIMIQLDRPPYLSVRRVAEEVDFRDHAMAFELYQKEARGRAFDYTEGYPLALWPACGEALFKMCADRDIYTVDALAKAKTKDMPAELQELADRAQQLVKLQGGAAKYEELLKERDGRITALEETVADAMKTIAQQKTLIDTLKVKAVG
jgi:hypothetical protein